MVARLRCGNTLLKLGISAMLSTPTPWVAAQESTGTVLLDGETISFTIQTCNIAEDGTNVGIVGTDEDGNEVRITMAGPAGSAAGRQQATVLLAGRQGARSAGARNLRAGRNRSGGRPGPTATYLAVYDRDAEGAWRAWGQPATGPLYRIDGSTISAEGDFRDATREPVEMAVSIACSS